MTSRRTFLAGMAAIPAVHMLNVSSADALVPDVTVGPFVRNNSLLFGFTHDQGSLLGDPAAILSARDLIRRSTRAQSTQCYGWGMWDPTDPSGDPLQAGWKHDQGVNGLDDRVQVRMSDATAKHIALAVAGPSIADGGTFANAPQPAKVATYAQLCARIAERYTDVKHFSVWNEMKGMWRSDLNNWDNPRYVALYDAVYSAVVAVRPDAIVYGPYVVLVTYPAPNAFTVPQNPALYPVDPAGEWFLDARSWGTLKYFLQNRARPSGWQTRQGISLDMTSGNTANPNGSINKWGVVDAAVRNLDPAVYLGCDSMPLIWSEWYSWNGTAPRTDDQDVAGVCADLCSTMLTSASLAFMWDQQGTGSSTKSFPMAVHTDTNMVGGGQPTALYDKLRQFVSKFPIGSPLYSLNCPAGVTGIAGPVGGSMVLVNRQNVSRTVNVQHYDGTVEPVVLSPYRVKFVVA